jgi:hypothetical protein
MKDFDERISFSFDNVAVIENNEHGGRIMGSTTLLLTPYLCPACPNVHFDVQLCCDGVKGDKPDVVFAIRMSNEKAARLAEALMTPPAFQPEDLSEGK